MPRLDGDIDAWIGRIRQIESRGFSSVSVSEHLTLGWKLDPLIAMTAAALSAPGLRVLSLVLANDFRHPVIIHKAIATLDVLSEGRVELGLGTGWLASDYEASGLRLDPPNLRIERLAEAVDVIRGLFLDEPLTYSGRHYRITALDGLPKPVQRPAPPILIGGGGRRILELAGRKADIVGLHARLAGGRLEAGVVTEFRADRMAMKVAWAREAAAAAGRRSDDLEFQCTAYLIDIRGRAPRGTVVRSTFADLLAASPEVARESPAVLVGSVDQCVDRLRRWRDELGISYWNLGPDVDAVAPIVERLSGRY